MAIAPGLNESTSDQTQLNFVQESGKTPTDDIPPCQHPMEAVQDLRYRPDDSRCPICHGRLPRMGKLHEKEDKIMSAPPLWKVAPKGEFWENTGPHYAVPGVPHVKQRLDLQHLKPHYETNAASHFEKGVKTAREAATTKSAKSREAALSQAAGWFRSAAFGGHLKGMYQIGMCYLEGRGTPKNPKEGVAFLTKAAKEDAEAAFELGQCYHFGRGVEPDENLAATWWRKAQELGHLHAQEALNRSAAAAASALQHAKTAQMRRRADAGDPEAQYQVAVRMMEGFAMTRDENGAAQYYRMAAMQGHAGAQCALALCYTYGRGVGSDMQEAVKWMTLAANGGHGIALAELAAMYEDGIGVQKDTARASVLRKQAGRCEKVRVLEYYKSQAQPLRGTITVKANDIVPHLQYVKSQLLHLQRTLAVVDVSKYLLACKIRRRLRRNPQALLDMDLQEWTKRRARTVALEEHLRGLFQPLCLLMGREPHPIAAEEALTLMQDIEEMMKQIHGGHSFEKSRQGRWDRAAHQATTTGRQHGGVASLADAAVHVVGEKLLELHWDGDQVDSKEGLQPLDYVDFIVRYERQTAKMSAVSIARMVVGKAPMPGAILVLPRGAEPQEDLMEVDKRKHRLEAELGSILAKVEEGTSLDEKTEERRAMLVERLSRTREEHSMRKAQVYAHKSEWWGELWAEPRARPICDRDELFAAHSIVEEQYQRVRGQVTHVEDGDPDAQLELGYMYMIGAGAARNPEKAVHWFERAALQGQVQAKCALAVCHATGAGVPRENRRKAKDLFEEAACMGLPLASTYLADMHRYGSGLEHPDHLEMLDHIRGAVLSSDKPSNAYNRAGNRLGEVYSHAGILTGDTKFSMESNKRLVPRNDAKATALFLEASKTPGIDAKYSPALTNLGEMNEYLRVPLGRRDGENEDARARWRDACENKALELYAPSDLQSPIDVSLCMPLTTVRSRYGEASGRPALDERALSNLRAIPAHLSGMAGSEMGWGEYVNAVGERLTRIIDYDD